MDKESLELLLSCGLSVERIAKRFSKDPSTYFVLDEGARSGAAEPRKYAGRGG